MIDAGLVERLNEARRFGQGLRYARQWLYASFDLALTGPTPGRLDGRVGAHGSARPSSATCPAPPFPAPSGTSSAATRPGYYGYMWAEVIALDMLSAFGDDVMNPARSGGDSAATS